MSTDYGERIAIFEYDREAPRGREWYWKRALVVMAIIAGLLLVADLFPLVQPVVNYAHERIGDL